MVSKNTFKSEFDWFYTNLPSALALEEGKSVEDFFSNYFGLGDAQGHSNEVLIFPVDDNYFADLFYTSETLHPIEIFESGLSPSTLEHYLNGEIIAEQRLKDFIVQFGKDTFGCYLAMHKFFRNKITPWGIYLFPEIILSQATQLHSIFQDEITMENCFKLYAYCVYRHELFHYQTEKYATGFEVNCRKPYYLNYNSKIYQKYALTEDWLEEALAEASVLKSQLVSKRSSIPLTLMKKIYEYDLKSMPPGYRDYGCKKYGGEAKAHLYLASQILNLENYLPLPTDIHTIKSDFKSNDKVPVYFVKGIDKIIKVQ
jgi:hypothetical protein